MPAASGGRNAARARGRRDAAAHPRLRGPGPGRLACAARQALRRGCRQALGSTGVSAPLLQHVATSPAACRPLRRGAGAHTATSLRRGCCSLGVGRMQATWRRGGLAQDALSGRRVQEGHAGPGRQLMRAGQRTHRCAVRSNTHRNSAPQRLHGFPALPGVTGSPSRRFAHSLGITSRLPCRYACVVPDRDGRPLHFTIWAMLEVHTCRAANCGNPMAAQKGNTWRRPGQVHRWT